MVEEQIEIKGLPVHDKRISSGFTLLVNYAWSNALDNADLKSREPLPPDWRYTQRCLA
jgi:hypothetical protein